MRVAAAGGLQGEISVLFLTVPVLNPGGYNAVHWINMVVGSSTPKPVYWVMFPSVNDFTWNPEVYALPLLLYQHHPSGHSCRRTRGSGPS